MSFKMRVTHEPKGLVSYKETLEANRRWEVEYRRLPQHMVPVPQGFSKALDNSDLDEIVIPYHARLVEELIARANGAII